MSIEPPKRWKRTARKALIRGALFIGPLSLVAILNWAEFCWRDFTFYHEESKVSAALEHAYDKIKRDVPDKEEFFRSARVRRVSTSHPFMYGNFLTKILGLNAVGYKIHSKGWKIYAFQDACRDRTRVLSMPPDEIGRRLK